MDFPGGPRILIPLGQALVQLKTRIRLYGSHFPYIVLTPLSWFTKAILKLSRNAVL